MANLPHPFLFIAGVVLAVTIVVTTLWQALGLVVWALPPDPLGGDEHLPQQFAPSWRVNGAAGVTSLCLLFASTLSAVFAAQAAYVAPNLDEATRFWLGTIFLLAIFGGIESCCRRILRRRETAPKPSPY